MEREEMGDINTRLSYSNIVTTGTSTVVAHAAAPGGDGGRPPGLPQTPYAGSLQRSRNTLPKARQWQGPPDPVVISATQVYNTTYGSRMFSNSKRYPSAGGSGRNLEEAGSNNTLPRAARKDSRPPKGGGVGGGGQYSSYGTLPRNNRQQRGGGGRPQSWYGGGGGSLPRQAGGSRGGPMQETGMPPRAPSQRLIYRSRRQTRQTSETDRSKERIRARSLPRLAARDISSVAGDLSLAKSIGTIWSPDGKCPSFADILKRSSYTGSVDLVADFRGNFKYGSSSNHSLICDGFFFMSQIFFLWITSKFFDVITYAVFPAQ